MSYKKIFWGILLILLGILFVLRNLNIIDISWSEIWHLWPLLFILWGVSVLPVKDYVKLALSLVVVAGAFYLVQNPDYQNSWKHGRFHREWYHDQDEENAYSYRDQEFSEPWDSAISEAHLSFEGGAGEFTIAGATSDLVALHTQGRATYSMESGTNDGIADVRILMRNFKGSNKRNMLDVKLNPTPLWDIEIDCGAAELKADLRDYRVRSVNIDGGAAELKLALGSAYPETNVNIDAGASDLKIIIPKSSGCEIKLSAVLTDKNLPGFEKQSNGIYRSRGFDQSANKIFIEVDVAVAKFEVERY